MRNADAYTVSINEATKRFEVHTEGEDSYIDFRWYEDRLVLLYIYVPPPFRGKGVSQSLIEFALQTAREKISRSRFIALISPNIYECILNIMT